MSHSIYNKMTVVLVRINLRFEPGFLNVRILVFSLKFQIAIFILILISA